MKKSRDHRDEANARRSGRFASTPFASNATRARAAFSVALLLMAYGLAPAQVSPAQTAPAQTAPAQTAPGPRLQEHPLEELRRTQPVETEQYELGPGDEIKVTVVARPELSGSHVLGPDGRVSMPPAGSVALGGLSRQDADAALSKALSTFYVDPVATIEITKYGSNRILLLGDVEHPGVLYFDGVPTLLEAITRGGVSGGISDKNRHTPTQCILYRGADQIGTVNLKDVFRTGDIRLHRNDIVYVPGDRERLISILGEVKSPGPVPLRDNSTLITLLADAGGLTDAAGNPMVQVIDPATGQVRRIAFKDLLTPKGNEVKLAVGDIVYVPKSGIAKVGYVLQQISPAAQLATIGTLTSR